jgi:hypothetical protein
MVVIEINSEPDDISCRWIDNNGQKHVDEFLAQELGKKSDLAPRISVI